MFQKAVVLVVLCFLAVGPVWGADEDMSLPAPQTEVVTRVMASLPESPVRGMPWGLLAVCLVVFALVTLCSRSRLRKASQCPMGCRGCGHCFQKKRERP